MELSKNKHHSTSSVKRIVEDKLENAIHYLKMYKNRHLIPSHIYNEISNSVNIALEISKSFRNKIIVTGLINSGKSTFINKLIGKFILHTSTLENSKWPIIIRNSQEEIPRLYSTKLANGWIYQLEEDCLLAEGIEEVDKQLKFINFSSAMTERYKQLLLYLTNHKNDKSKSRDHDKSNNISSSNNEVDNRKTFTKHDKSVLSNSKSSVRQSADRDCGVNEESYKSNNEEANEISKFSEVKHCEFIFILKVKVEFLSQTQNSDRCEIWDLPGFNSENRFFNEYVVSNLIQNESNINNSFPFIDFSNYCMRRICLVYISDYSTFNQLHNKNLWSDIQIFKDYSHRIFFIINKIDQMSEGDFPLISKNFSTDNTINSHILEEMVKSHFHVSEDMVSQFYLSSLYSYLELCEQKKNLNSFYWKTKEILFNSNGSLKQEFKSFDKYKKYTNNRVMNETQENEDNYEFLMGFAEFEQELSEYVNGNKFIDYLLKNCEEVIKTFIFDKPNPNKITKQTLLESEIPFDARRNRSNSIESYLLSNKPLVNTYNSAYYSTQNSNSSNFIQINNTSEIGIVSTLLTPLNNIQNLFNNYFRKFKHYIKFGLNFAELKMKKRIEYFRIELDEFIKDIKLFSKDKALRIAQIYLNTINSINELKNEFTSRILKENLQLVIKLQKELINLNLKPSLIENFTEKINIELKSELESFEDIFVADSNSFIEDISLALSSGLLNGALTFLGTNMINTLMSAKGASVAVISSTVFCIIISLGCFLYCAYKQFQVINDQNKEKFLKQEAEIWEKVIKYNNNAIFSLKNFANSTRKNMNVCKYKINGFFSFVKKLLDT